MELWLKVAEAPNLLCPSFFYSETEYGLFIRDSLDRFLSTLCKLIQSVDWNGCLQVKQEVIGLRIVDIIRHQLVLNM